MIKILLVDDDKLILQSLKLTLKKAPDMEVIAATSDGYEALALCHAQLPDLILMDIQMPKVDGITTTKLIKDAYPDLPIMMLTTFADLDHIKDALAAGAGGYVLKTDPLADLATKIRAFTAGIGIMSQDALKALTPKVNPLINTLTPREQSIAKLVADGLSNKEIAAQLHLSEGTIRNNLVVVMEKMDVSNRTQLSKAYYL